MWQLKNEHLQNKTVDLMLHFQHHEIHSLSGNKYNHVLILELLNQNCIL